VNKFCVSIFLLSISIGAFSQTITVGSTTEQLTASERGSVATYWPDGSMGAIYHNGTNYVFGTTADPGTVQITLPNLNTWTSGLNLDTPTTNIQFGGSNSFDENYVGGGAVYYDSASGYLIELYHGEQWFGGGGSPFYAAHGLAYSTDFGANWHKLGEVVSPQAAWESGGTDCQSEIGNGTLTVVGSYLYDYITDQATGCPGSLYTTVARASISAVIAAAEAGTPFTSGPGTLFMKYTGSGTWNGDGVTDLANPQNGGGASTQIATVSSGEILEPNVRYDSYLNDYIMVYSNLFTDVEAQTSPDGLSWGNTQVLVSGGSYPTNTIYYPTLFNASGGDPQTLGQDFLLLWVQPLLDPAWTNTNLYSAPLSVSGGTDYTLSTATNGTGSGTVAGCAGSYASGASYDCTLTAGSGSTLAGASGCSGTLSGTTYSGDMPASNCTVTATFNSSNISLTVNKAGSGSGTVSGTNCATGSYASGTQIGACTATANTGSTFAGWSASGSSSCSGTGSCAQFSLTATTTLTATFNTTGGGTPTYVQAVAAPGAFTTNPSTTISITPTAGDTLTVWAVGSALSSFNTPTASGLTFTSHGTSIGSSSQGIWTAPVTSTGSYTITISGSSSSTVALAGIAVETSNTTTSGIVLSSFGSASCGSSCTGSSLTTTSANSMVLTFMWYGVGLGSLTSPSPFAFTSVNGGDSGWGMYNGAGYYLKSSTGSYTPTWTASGDPYMPNVSVALAP
jgi:hypothetical protein